MNTIEKIKIDGSDIVRKLKNGEMITNYEHQILKIYNSLFSKGCPTSGKRIKKVNKQHIK